jgi:nickel/cobalt transporter (NicO) family protein
MLLAARLLWSIRPRTVQGHQHHHDHSHDHDHPHHDHGDAEDAHAAAHAREIETRFTGGRSVSAGEIAWFGFTGGLLPCPAAIAVLLVCLQLKAFTLGIAMVAAFSIGLAATLVGIGIMAAWGTRRAAKAWSGFDVWSRRMPYISGALVMALGLLITLRGLWSLGVFPAA